MTLRSRYATIACAFLAGLLVLSLTSPCAAQRTQAGSRLKQLPLDFLTPYGQRTDAFRRLLYELKFQPLDRFVDLQANPSESILIMLGDPHCLSKGYFPEGLRSFVEQGGAVLIATDKKTDGEASENLIELAGVRVMGETLMCFSPNTADLYDASPYCPFVQPIPAPAISADTRNVLGALAAVVGVGGGPGLFRNPHPDQPDLRVATNAPSWLQKCSWRLPGAIHRLAYLPWCEDEARVFRYPDLAMLPYNRSRTQSRPLFAVGGTVGKGRVLVLADHSIFINRMILPRDTGNLEFAANCLHWLRGDASTPDEMLHAVIPRRGGLTPPSLNGQRDKVLFWEDGIVHRDFRVPMKEVSINPPRPSEPAIVAALNRGVRNMENQNAFNRQLLDGLEERNWSPERLDRSILYALTLVLLLFLGYLFVWRGRHRVDVAVPLLGYAVAHHEPKLSLLEQRRRSMLRSGNVWETAHRLARQYFESAGLPLTGTSAPRLAVRGGWWRRWRVNRRMARLWELARGDAPVPISTAALKRWLRELEELKTALANETIRLT